MTDIFEIETSTLAPCTWMPGASRVLLTDFVCVPIRVVTIGWIFRVLDKAGLLF